MRFLSLADHSDLTQAQQTLLNDLVSLDQFYASRTDASGQKLLRNLAKLGYGTATSIRSGKGVRFDLTAKIEVVRTAGPFDYVKLIPTK